MTEEYDLGAQSMDKLDRQLVAELQGDPRLAYASLGSRLGVTGMTAANRLQRLRQADLVRLRVTPNLEACGLTTEVIGLIQADVTALGPCVATLSASPYALRVDHVTGEYDLSFVAAFPSEAAMGMLVRDLQSVSGVRRLVVHHRLETLKDSDGWDAVWAEPKAVEPSSYEVAAGTRIPDHLKARVALGADWLSKFIAGDLDLVRRLSTVEVVFTIMPPQIGAGTYDGIDAVLEQSKVASHNYRHFWQRVIAVSETDAPYSVMIDSINTVERQKGVVRTAFARVAFAFSDGRVDRVLSLGQMDLPDVPSEATERPAVATANA